MTPAFHDNEGPPPVGYFTYSVVGDHWAWSDGMYTLHGLQRGRRLAQHRHASCSPAPRRPLRRLRDPRQRLAGRDTVHLLSPRHRSPRAGTLGAPRRSRGPRRPGSRWSSWRATSSTSLPARGAPKASPRGRRDRAGGVLSPRAVRPGRHDGGFGFLSRSSLTFHPVVVQGRLAVHGLGQADRQPAISWSARPKPYATARALSGRSGGFFAKGPRSHRPGPQVPPPATGEGPGRWLIAFAIGAGLSIGSVPNSISCPMTPRASSRRCNLGGARVAQVPTPSTRRRLVNRARTTSDETVPAAIPQPSGRVDRPMARMIRPRRLPRGSGRRRGRKRCRHGSPGRG